LQSGKHPEAGKIRHPDIGHDEVRAKEGGVHRGSEQVEQFGAVARFHHVVPYGSQARGDGLSHGVVVVRHEDR
jgi:hypothetical protein